MLKEQVNSHNPYFNRWFSAIQKKGPFLIHKTGHNPYFNRWFSAILLKKGYLANTVVTILILIDGFLQFIKALDTNSWKLKSQSLF